jgi:hypothetical protein
LRNLQADRPPIKDHPQAAIDADAPSKADGSVMTPDLRNLCHLQDMKADAAEQVDAAIRRAISAEPQGNRGNLRSSDHMAVAHFDRMRSEISIRRDGRAV